MLLFLFCSFTDAFHMYMHGSIILLNRINSMINTLQGLGKLYNIHISDNGKSCV